MRAVRRLVTGAVTAAVATGSVLLTAGAAQAATGGPLARYYTYALGDSSYYHWTTADPSQLPAGDGYAYEESFGYPLATQVTGSVPLYSCTETFGGTASDVFQYLSTDPTGTCLEGGAVDAKALADGHTTPPTVAVLGLEGYIYSAPPADGIAVTAVYPCIADHSPIYLTSPLGFTGTACNESSLYQADELLGYLPTTAQATPPPSLAEAPLADGLPLIALTGGGAVLVRRRRAA